MKAGAVRVWRENRIESRREREHRPLAASAELEVRGCWRRILDLRRTCSSCVVALCVVKGLAMATSGRRSFPAGPRTSADIALCMVGRKKADR